LTLSEALTTKQIAKAVDLPPSRLYYHVNLLDKHGLLKVADTRLVSGIVEKHFRAAAQFFTVDPGLFRPASPEASAAFDAAISAFFDGAKTEAIKSRRADLFKLQSADEEKAGHRPKVRLSCSVAYLTPENAELIQEKLSKIVNEIDTFSDPKVTEGQRYSLIVGFFPTLDAVQTDQEQKTA
jgi:hypothetical protein